MQDVWFLMQWDDEAEVWVCCHSGIIGLITAEETLSDLLHKIADIVPELARLNNQDLPSL